MEGNRVMNKRILFGLVCLLSVTLTGVAGVSAADPAHGSLVTGIEIHVSPDGADTQSGTVQAPVKTPEAARILARKHAGKEPITIIFADGVYYLDQTLVFTDEDSGSKSAPVVYKAAHEGKAVLSGGIPLKLQWTPHKDGISKAATPAGLELDQLFVNGARQHMARYPNYDPAKTTVPYRGSAADAIAPERAAKWANPVGGYIHAMHAARWGGYHYRITGKNDKGEVTYEGGWQNNRPSGMHKSARMVENIFEELDAPGEWFHDRKTNTLYFYPPAGLDLAKATVEGVRLATLIEVRGTQQKPVRFVTFDGFVFRHTVRTFMENKEPLLRSDWTIYRGGAILLGGAEDCNLLNCFIDQPGANAVFVNNYNRRLRLAGLHVFGAGASGVAFVGDPKAVRNPVFRYGYQKLSALDLTPGPQTDNYPMECVVEDSLFHEIGTVEKQGAGVQISMSRRITVRHCSIYDTSRAGININEGTWGGHLIEGCDVFNTVQETGDHGSFNSWGRDRYWLPRKGCGETVAAVAANPKLPFLDAMETNIIRDSRWRCNHGWDIDLDDGSSNYDIYNNLMLHGGLKFREGYRRSGANNIIVDNSFYPSVWYPKSNDVFKHNIVMGAYKPAFMYTNWDGELDRNLFTTSHQDRLKFAEYGVDANSIVGDPQFADPAKGDFTVRNEALAKAIGFKNFPMDRFGVQKPALKAIAKTPAMPNPVIKPDLTPFTPPAVQPAATVWLGATLGEPKGETLSAYGVAFDSGGVAIEKIQPKSPLAGAKGLREGDLIQGLNGTKITSIADLKKVVGGIKDGRLMLKVIRSQKEETVELKVGLRELSFEQTNKPMKNDNGKK